MATYIVTGRDTGTPPNPDRYVIAGLNVGDTFTTTLDSGVEAALIGAGLIDHYPQPCSVAVAGSPSAGGLVLTSVAEGSNEGSWQPSSGGSGSSGSRRTIACPFAYDSPGLLTGFAVYTPTVGDILHDAWFEIDTPWNGTTPMGDFGAFVSGYGLFGNTIGYPIDMTLADTDEDDTGALLLSASQSYGTSTPFGSVSLLLLGATTPNRSWRIVPGKLYVANPVKVCVSQNGQTTGADPGATQGAAVLYLDVSTPQSAS